VRFEDFKFLPRIASNIQAQGYTEPTPIQEQAIPSVLEGRDLIGLAETGTGKTAAFLLPILQRLSVTPAPVKNTVRALVIAPTRELAEQTYQAALDLGRQTRLRAVTIYGGAAFSPQARKLRAGVDIVIACPGRLLDHLNQRTVDLSHVETLVLDEADHMFDMGFLPDIRKILACLPAQRQTLLFSATMPEIIRKLARDILSDPVSIQIGNCTPVSTVSHVAYPVPTHLKTPLLLALLQKAEAGAALIFTRTKHGAKKLAAQIEKAGHSTASLHGNLSQRQRQAALDGFRDGEFKILVATDIAARGIDVTRVAHVINYDIPNTPDAYTHRIGRTGRAKRTGQAHSLITREDASMLRAIERLLGKPLMRRTLADFDYAARGGESDRDARPEPRGRFDKSRPQRDGAQGRPQFESGQGGRPQRDAGQSQPQRSSSKPAQGGLPQRFGGNRSGGGR